jgi:hypothetical protein
MPKKEQSEPVPVCPERIAICLSSAKTWAAELPRLADRKQRAADTWAILAGILAAVTSLSIWPLVTDSSSTPVKVVVSAFALASAVCTLVPRIKNYSETAGQARELAGKYGSLLGQLTDLHALGEKLNQGEALRVVTEFEATKAKKDALRGLPQKHGTDTAPATAPGQTQLRGAAAPRPTTVAAA